jgi:hypothetical protein
VNFIIEQLEMGGLQSAVRDPETGVMRAVPSNHWNFDRVAMRFTWCVMLPDQPNSIYAAGTGFQYIFIEKKGLEALLASQPFTVATQAFGGHLSPYLKVMHHIIQQWDIHPDNQPTVAALEQAVRDAWTGAEPLSDRLAKAMATLIREPESQGGRANKKK